MGSGRRKLHMGAGGVCVCPKCGRTVPHRSGTPCIKTVCPACGAKMVREGSDHHKALRRKEEA